MNELEGVRRDFINMLDKIPPDFWDRRTPGEFWTLKEEIVHITQAASLIPSGVQRVRRGPAGFSLLFLAPLPLRDWVNGHIIVPYIARSATVASAARQYEQAHKAILKCLESVQENEFQLSASFGSGIHRTIEEIFHRPAQHFKEHQASIQRKLQRL